jgi:thiosulfate dehydrogenase (quinone) large subunit
VLERTPPWTFALGRIMLGAMWLVSLRWKLPPDFMPGEGTPDFGTWLERQVETPAFGFYGDLIDSVVLPNFTLFAWLVFLVELAIGLSLLLGVFIRPAALVGALMSINLWIG